MQPAIDELAESLGGLDVLVNNAATGAGTPFLELELAQWRDVLEVDLTGALLTAQAAARRMVGTGTRGRIVNVTSVHEHVPLEGATPYVVAKHGLAGLTKMMALELAGHGITVNSVAPGEIATPMTGAADEDPRDEQRPSPRRPGGRRPRGGAPDRPSRLARGELHDRGVVRHRWRDAADGGAGEPHRPGLSPATRPIPTIW